MTNEERLQKLGITLPEAPAAGGLYTPFVQTGDLVFASGFVPAATEEPLKGKLGQELTIEQGQEAARLGGFHPVRAGLLQPGAGRQRRQPAGDRPLRCAGAGPLRHRHGSTAAECAGRGGSGI